MAGTEGAEDPRVSGAEGLRVAVAAKEVPAQTPRVVGPRAQQCSRCLSERVSAAWGLLSRGRGGSHSHSSPWDTGPCWGGGPGQGTAPVPAVGPQASCDGSRGWFGL